MSSNLIGSVINGQFRVESFVASGGMGAVYRVWDLSRNVYLAMKVLHAELAEDPALFKRFQREAKALQELAHPHIVTFYGVDQTADFPFLVERYIDGPSLKQVLLERKGQPLTVQEALIFLKALCSALGYAHSKGVVHCDIKPGNVMVDHGGSIYLADFGIARHAWSTTTTMGMAGTPAYMAPEQIQSHPVTPETDIYALGALLYEMLTGKRPFRGDEAGLESVGSTTGEKVLYAHLYLTPPDARQFNPMIPSGLAAVITKAMAKDPVQRYRSAQELFMAACAAVGITPDSVAERIALTGELATVTMTGAPGIETPDQGQPAPPAYPPSDEGRKTGLVVTGGVMMAGILFLIVMCGLAIIAYGDRFIPGMGGGVTASNTPGSAPPAAIASETFIPTSGGNNQATSTPQEEIQQPTPTFTIEVQTIAPTKTLTPVAPSPEGKIVFTCQIFKSEATNQICIMNADGSSQHRLTRDDHANHFYPSFSPDGNRIVFAATSGEIYNIYEMDLNGNQTQVTFFESGDAYSPAISPDGRQIVFTREENAHLSLWLMNRDGSNIRLLYNDPVDDSLDPVWSPDGRQVLFARGFDENSRQLYIINADGTDLIQVTDMPNLRGRSDWSSDGRSIATYAGASWAREIYIMNSDGSNPQQITQGGNNLAPSFSPDGGWIAFTSYMDNLRDNDGCEIYTMRTDGTDIRRLTSNDYCDWQPRWGK